MKKLIMILATVVLITGSVTSAAAMVHQKTKTNSVGSSKTTTNEDVEDIANKLFNKSIKLDPNFWLGKSIKDDQSQFNAAVVKDGVLTQDEIQYVTWGNLNINFAGYFVNKLTFSVTKDGAVATGTSTIDADTGET